MTVTHLIPGPAEHGVVRHALLIARALGHPVLRVADAAGLDALTVAELPAGGVLHLPWTDRLYGATLADAQARFASLRRLAGTAGLALSVTLHDVPHDGSEWQSRRRAVYREVVAAARGVVVNSRVELGLVQDVAADAGVHSLRVAPLPLEPRVAPVGEAPPPLPPRAVAVLGFVYPDRGYDEVLAALPPDATLAALGRAADGHEDLLDRYREQGAERWLLTGYLAEADLAAHLAAAAVPIAPNRRVTASASINTWLAHGRRPLVPDSAYARELDAERPGALALYDPDDPAALATAIADALADPASTRLDPGVRRGPALADVAAVYAEHLAACAPPGAVQLADRTLLPGNRWDLAPASDGPPPAVSVVVPYYENQAGLDRVLAALAIQDGVDGRLEIVIADDGSAVPPDLRATRGIPVQMVRQDDRGFRAAAARNLGAAAARGDVLVFLDGDTVPEPGFIAALTALPARCPDVLTVGRRRHTDLATGRELPEPAWLRDAYAGSRTLLDADRRSYRFVISAVLAMSRPLFARLGGFDERFVGYGGEDWELAHRAWCAGAMLAHVPSAVAWHDGPDWAARADAATRAAAKDHETLMLAALLPDPDARGPGRWWPYPSVVVHGGRMGAADALATVRSAAAAGVDCGFWFDELTGTGAELVLADPAVALGTPPPDVLARAWCRAWLHTPAGLADLMTLAERAERHGWVETPALRLRSARSLARTAGADDDVAQRLFGRHDRTDPRRDTTAPTGLAGRLARLRRG